ncbi:MAG: DUF2155 domain-containing protein [Alphaproteobacteria bacterium]|nr:DUF2155 domain-containing protein [Alphaproteobacteria bacterium]
MHRKTRTVLTPLKNKSPVFAGFIALLAFLAGPVFPALAAPSVDYPIVKLRSLDKISARTAVFEAEVGSTLKFGKVYIKVQACRKTPELEQPESAAFLQIWEAPPEKSEKTQSEWIFSGWMFASSPALSAMDHPIYDVWVLDCLEAKGQVPAADLAGQKTDEGELPQSAAPLQPDIETENLAD